MNGYNNYNMYKQLWLLKILTYKTNIGVKSRLFVKNENVPGTNITRAGKNIMTRNEYYRILTFRPECVLPGNEYYAKPVPGGDI